MSVDAANLAQSLTDFTPDGILSAIGDLDAQARILAHEIFDAPDHGVDVPGQFQDAWNGWTQEWSAWKVDHQSWISRAWNTTRDELLTFAERYNFFQQQWTAMVRAGGGATYAQPAGSVPPPKGGLTGAIERLGKDLGVASEHVIVAALVVVVLGAGAYVAWKARG